MFGLIRVLIGVIFFIIYLLIAKITKLNLKKRHYILSVFASIVLITVLAFVPFENLFVTFSSPKAVFNYMNFGKSEIKLIVTGNKTAFVIGGENTNKLLIVPKTENGWKIGTGYKTQKAYSKITDDLIIDVYQYQNTDDYYIAVYKINGGQFDITDSNDSVFYPLGNTSFYTYYAYIPKYNSHYWILVNGEKIVLKTNG